MNNIRASEAVAQLAKNDPSIAEALAKAAEPLRLFGVRFALHKKAWEKKFKRPWIRDIDELRRLLVKAGVTPDEIDDPENHFKGPTLWPLIELRLKLRGRAPDAKTGRDVRAGGRKGNYNSDPNRDITILEARKLFNELKAASPGEKKDTIVEQVASTLKKSKRTIYTYLKSCK